MNNSTTERYGFVFIIPIALKDTPINFAKFAKYDEEGVEIGKHSYVEWCNADHHEYTETPSGTHVLLGANITSTKVRKKFEDELEGTPFTVHDGEDVEQWTDENQDYHLWIVPTEPKLAYGYNVFVKVSPLFKEENYKETT